MSHLQLGSANSAVAPSSLRDRNAWQRRFQTRHFCILAFPGTKERFFSVGTLANSQAGKIVFLTYCYRLWVVGRNVRILLLLKFLKWTSQSEFGEDNLLTRNTGSRLQNWRGPTYLFTGGQGFLPFPQP